MPPINKNRVRTAVNDTRLRTALASLLRHLGVLGGVTPTDAELVRLASDYAAGKGTVMDDGGRVWNFADCLAENREMDKDIPF